MKYYNKNFFYIFKGFLRKILYFHLNENIIDLIKTYKYNNLPYQNQYVFHPLQNHKVNRNLHYYFIKTNLL